MRHCIARALVACIHALLALILPPQGRHRRVAGGPLLPPTPPEPPGDQHPARDLLPAHRSPYAAANAAVAPLTGEDVQLLRPYVLLHEERQADVEKRRRQAERRNALLLALDGIDIGPETIHGVRVPMPAAAAAAG